MVVACSRHVGDVGCLVVTAGITIVDDQLGNVVNTLQLALPPGVAILDNQFLLESLARPGVVVGQRLSARAFDIDVGRL